MKKLYFLLAFAIVANAVFAQNEFDKQGHRGARGLMPENTIQGMKLAMNLGVNTLEMDIYFSKDKKPVVSHDPYFNSKFVLTPDGKTIPEKDQRNRRLYDYNYDEIRKYNVGTKPHPDFPQQKKMHAYIPLLSELIDSVELYAKQKKYPRPKYNMETKTTVKGDDIDHPGPEEFVREMMKVIKSKKIEKRVTIQSFDIRTLEVIHAKHKKIKTSYLVWGKETLDENLKKLTFRPDIYSPYYKQVDRGLIEKCHALGIKVIPWTVNTKGEIKVLKDLGVDGIISDYPNLF